MSEIAHYEKQFVERTRDILKDYKGEYKLSNAINCTLGLLILPSETLNESTDPIWDILIADIPQLSYLRIQRFEPIQKKTKKETKYYDKTLRILLKKIRNGIAHQNLQPVNRNGLFIGVIIRNYFGEGKGDWDLEIEFNREELETFAFFIAGKYLGN